uniref:Uncharacterized protein n=1 Tax=Lygus hesperus TaxID=30085 RepID=A0A146M0T5_LYGHE
MTILFSQMEAKRQAKYHTINSQEGSTSNNGSESHGSAENTKEEIDVSKSESVSPDTLRKIMLCLITPLLFLILYNGFWFAAKFITFTITFYYLSLAYFVAEVAIRPP